MTEAARDHQVQGILGRRVGSDTHGSLRHDISDRD